MRSRLTVLVGMASLMASAPAYAETVTVKDSLRDVVEQTDSARQIPRPRERVADMTKFVITHSQRNVVFTIHTAAPIGRAQMLATVEVKTPTGEFSVGMATDGQQRTKAFGDECENSRVGESVWPPTSNHHVANLSRQSPMGQSFFFYRAG